MDTGGVGELLGVAMVPVAWLVGRRFGPKAKKKFERTFLLVALWSVGLLLVLALIWWAIAS